MLDGMDKYNDVVGVIAVEYLIFPGQIVLVSFVYYELWQVLYHRRPHYNFLIKIKNLTI